MPWNWIVSLTIPAPGVPARSSTLRYASASVAPRSVRPSRLASFLSGRSAIRLPPALTQSVSIVTCAVVSADVAEHDLVESAQHRR